MNLIDDRWIPIRRADGSTDKIAPWEITQDIHDEKRKIIAVASPRPDFDGALTQFLIGLLQTACTPETEDAWWGWQEKPPLPDALKVCFEPYEEAFTIYENKTIIDTKDDSKLFMQELLAGNNRAKPHPVSYLLIEASTDNALKTNTDHFQKRPKVKEFMCKDCAAAALYTLQTFAPSGGGGGDGKATSLRGGGPLSTIILGGNLWETVWLNVIMSGDFARRKCEEKTFPWLNIEHFISDQIQVKTIHSQEMNPEHVFWGMPRRIQLDFSAFNNTETCSICGSQEKFMCHRFFDLTGGLTYQHKQGSTKRPSWINPLHPLSPYTWGENGIPSAVHQHGGIGYRYWLGFIENVTAGNTQRIPAKVVEQFRTIVHKDGQLWAFGYDMDKAKARRWHDATMPILYTDNLYAPIFSAHASNMINASRYVSGLLVSAVLKAKMVDPKLQRNPAGYMEVDWKWPKDLLGRLRKSPTEKTNSIKEKINQSVEELESRVQNSMMSLLDSVRLSFWSTTEESFYMHLKAMRDAIEKRTSEPIVLGNWLAVLKQEAVKLFDFYAEAGDFNAADPRRIALSYNEFLRSLNSHRLKNIIGLQNNPTNNP
jgi:CRISPR system Cascade subunit CasA